MLTERLEDMSSRGFLRLMKEDDGDIIISVGECSGDGIVDPVASVQFCTVGSGGGASPRVRAALIQLMGAMAEDNLDPRYGFRAGEHAESAEQQVIATWARECRQERESQTRIQEAIAGHFLNPTNS